MESLRKFRSEGNQIVDLVNDLIFQSKITQTEIAYQTGKSDAQISLILNPLHCAQFTLLDLPILMRLLDGEKIARAICSFINMVPATIPTSKVSVGHVMTEIGHLSTAIGDAIGDGEISAKEVAEIKSELLDVIASVDTLTANQGRGT